MMEDEEFEMDLEDDEEMDLEDDPNEEEEIELEDDPINDRVTEVELPTRSVENLSDEIKRPSVILTGFKTPTELEFLKGLTGKGGREVPLYVEFQGITKELSTIELTARTMTLLNYISADYGITLISESGVPKKIDYTNPNFVEKFITL